MPTEQRTTALNRIAPESSWLTRRLASVIISIWFGGILLVALSAPGSFRSVDSILASPPENVAKSMEKLGPVLTRQILEYQASETNLELFGVWGWTQLGLAIVVVIMLLFLSNVGRLELGLSLGMLLMALLMNFVLVPRIAETGRILRTPLSATVTEVSQRFRLMHYGFTAFELIVVALGTLLLVLLLRSRRGGNYYRSRIEEI